MSVSHKMNDEDADYCPLTSQESLLLSLTGCNDRKLAHLELQLFVAIAHFNRWFKAYAVGLQS